MDKILLCKKSSILRIAMFGMILFFAPVFSFGNHVSAESGSNMDVWLKGTMNYDFAGDILTQVNREREKAGLTLLKMDKELTDSAGIRARECILRYSHDRPVPADWTAIIPAGYRHAGENLAIGYNTASEVVAAWMDSPTHRANILGKDYKALGAAVFEYTNSMTGKTVYTCAQHFSNSFGEADENRGKESSEYVVADDVDYYPLTIKLLFGGDSRSDLALSPGEVVPTIIKISAEEIWGQKFVTADAKTLKWSVADPEVAEITTDGKIKAKTIGKTSIEAVSSDKSFNRTIDIFVKKSIYSAEIDRVKPQHYTGEEIEPDVTVLDGEEKLVNGVDYDIVYSDNLYPGTAKIHIIGKGDYGDGSIMYFSVYDDSTVIKEGFLGKIRRFFGWD